MDIYKDSTAAIDDRISDLIGKMTVEEKIGQIGQVCMFGFSTKREKYLNGVRQGRWGSRILADTEWAGNNAESGIDIDELNEVQRVAVEESRLGIPIIYARDVIYGQSTVLPIPLAQAAAWDPQSVEQAYSCIAREAASVGIHWTFSPMMDVCRDPRWGRIIETSGEDSYLTAQSIKAVIRGFQGEDSSAPDRLVACAKHFCGYGFSEGGRDYDCAEISENTLHNVVLPPFKAAVDAGVATVMSSFNDLGGTPVSGSEKLLQGWLKDGCGFDGVVVSDWGSVDDLERFGVAEDNCDSAAKGFNAGVDMSMLAQVFQKNMPSLIEQGKVSTERLDDAVTRILRTKFRAGLFENPYVDPELHKSVLRCDRHRQVARKLAEKSLVLLKNNDSVLPLAKRGKKVAVVGPYTTARRQHLGSWSIDGKAEDVVSLLEGIQKAAPDLDVVTAPPQFTDEMVHLARSADYAVVCVGESHVRNGEACCIADLVLPPGQEELIAAIGKTGTPMVVVQCTGRPIPSPATELYAKSLIYAWQGGTEIGDAVAAVLFGDVVPSGKLPVSIPRSTGQIPIYYNRKPKGKALAVPNYLAYQDMEESPLYSFGFGLSYTSFEYSDIELSSKQIAQGETIYVSVTVTNTGIVAAEEVAQCYIRDLVSSSTRPVRELKGFERVLLAPGESKCVTFDLGPGELAFYGANQCFEVEPGEFEVFVGADSNATFKTSFGVR